MILAISGKIGSGKDTVGKIIQYLTRDIRFVTYSFEQYLTLDNPYPYEGYKSKFQIQKFAGFLKTTVANMIGCTVEQLEDNDFKNTPLGEEWTRYAYAIGHGRKNKQITMWDLTCTKEEYEEQYEINWQTAYKEVMTPRKLLQLLGTQAMRDVIHQDIHVNALFSKYKPTHYLHKTLKNNYIPFEETAQYYPEALDAQYPNWIITDMRFPNELKAVKDRGGISIRVNRYPQTLIESRDSGYEEIIPFDSNNQKHIDLWLGECSRQHESETALDNAKFDYVIDNNGSIEELIEKVKEILIKENII